MRSPLVVLALAVLASASPLRLSAEYAEALAPQASVAWDEVPVVIEMPRAPCKKHTRRPAGFGRFAGVVPASIEALLSKLAGHSGSTTAAPAGVRHDPTEPPLSVDDIESAPPALDADGFRRLTDLAIAQLMGPPELEGPKAPGLPLLPTEPPFVTFVHGPIPPPERHQAHPPPSPAHQHYGGLRSWSRRAHTFAARLQRALRALTPIEALIVAFVLGSGIGSILHFFFMVGLLAMRKCSAASRSHSQTQRSALALEGDDVMVQNVIVAPVNEKEQVPPYDSVVPPQRTA